MVVKPAGAHGGNRFKLPFSASQDACEDDNIADFFKKEKHLLIFPACDRVFRSSRLYWRIKKPLPEGGPQNGRGVLKEGCKLS